MPTRLFLLSIYVVFLCCPVRAASFTPDGDVIGDITHYFVETQDNLYEIARSVDVGIVELLAANPGIDPWLPPADTILVIPGMHVLPAAPRRGIVINLSELRLFYYEGSGKVLSFPIGIGSEGWRTPLGSTRILRKRENPSWLPPPAIRAENPDLPEIVPPGSDNPLGKYALYLGFEGILIHGTNRPYGVGKRSSHGCIRLYPEDIAILFSAVKPGTPVAIIDAPFKLGWRGKSLFLEVTPNQSEADMIAEYRIPQPQYLPEIYDAVRKLETKNVALDWFKIEKIIARRSGIPVQIGQKP